MRTRIDDKARGKQERPRANHAMLRETEERLATIAVCEFFAALGRLMRGKSGCNTAGRPPVHHESGKHRETRMLFEKYRIVCNAPWRD